MYGFVFISLGLSLATAFVKNGIEIHPLLKSETSLSFEVLSASHFQYPTTITGLNQIKLKINHENKDHILQFNKNELFHPEFTVSAATENEINDVTEAVKNWISKDCYYHSEHGAISFCDALEGVVKLDGVNYRIYSSKNDSNSNQIRFFMSKQYDDFVDTPFTNNHDINEVNDRRVLLPNGYPSCTGGYWNLANSKKTAYISLFVAVSPRLQKYNHYANDWQTFSSIPGLVAARVNTFQQNYHNIGFDSNQFAEATITLNFKLKHLHIMNKESETAYTTAYDVKDYVDANNLYDLYGPWSLGAMFIYGTDWPNGVADYPNSDSGAKPDSACTFGCALQCQLCSDLAYYATDPEREFNMEHEGGHMLGATHDPNCELSSGQPTNKDAYCGTGPSVMCSSGTPGGYGWGLPKGVGCSYDEMSCCIDNILQTSECLNSPFDFNSYTTSDTDCISVEEASGSDLIVKCMGNLRITAGKLIDTIPIVNHFKTEFTISINTLPTGYTNILNVGAIDANAADRYPGIFIFSSDATNFYFHIGITNNPTTPSESFIRCQTQTLTLPVTDIPVIIEADQTNNIFTVTINGNACTDAITNALSFSSAIGSDKNIYIPTPGDPILTDGTIKDLIFTLYGTSMNPTASPSQPPTVTYCESVQRYDGTSLISECLGDVNMKSGTLIDTIPLVNHFKIEFELSIVRLNTGFTNVLFVGSPNGDVSDRYPSIFINNNGGFGKYFQIGLTNNPTTPTESVFRCQTQMFGLPITAMSVMIEVDGASMTVSINGNQCTDSLSSAISYTATGFKNIYIPNSDGILSGGMQNLVITMYDQVTECILGTNYWLEGNQAFAEGDPHFKMWNGDYHDLQGVGSIDNQYLYITRDSTSTSKDLPFNILGKHYYWVDGNTQMRALEYITFQLFDSNNDYYLIFLQNNILKYTTNAVPFSTTSTLYNSIDTALLSTFTVGIQENIGKLFVAEVTSQTTNTIHFTLTVGGTCELTLYMLNIGSPKSAINNRYVQNLYVNPPTCYKCFITGLFGDFKRANVDTGAHRERRNAEIPLCNGGYQNIKAGWTTSTAIDPMVQNTAFDSNGLSYDTTFCDRGPSTRRRILNNAQEYIISAPDDFVYVDACPSDSATAQLTITECENIRIQYDSTVCASDAMISICDSLQSNCEYDACVIANGDTSKVADAVANIFGNTLGFLETIPSIVDLYNPDDIVAEPGAPTDYPTSGPTMEPTEIIVVETTKEKEGNFAQKINVSWLLLYVTFGLIWSF